ncbi:class I SAM-dependent methyltransferase [Bradyrhizobium sp. 138]|uniref:class I SAM-dependent methyltransferase n=1 Tax=Bradyrhizobium sp. 138 TaxID=2782615 RepID=UPI001FF984B3|nr:class I SAM-dependent methyltransferase [Bradyrhizobium sp. 138]MCK1738593.1 class I SAM-dependent methyltransferase [Bradyrhizobium sp. 138]
MDIARQEHEQMRLWNGPAGRAWVEAQDILGEMFKQFEGPLIEAVRAGSARRVLDLGCGTGGLTVAAARKLGEGGGVVGIDISAPMIATALARGTCEGASVGFICADAQRHEFEAASFDTVISRLGVMFFDDPVAAFVNLRRAVTEGAELRFIAWRSAVENPFMTTAERAAAPLLPDLPVRRPDGPGQFAFADRDRVRAILQSSGWIDIDIRAIDIPCSFRASDLRRYITWLGPVGTILQNADEAMRERVIDAVRPGFDDYVQGALICFTAACWAVSARAQSGDPGEVPNG